MDKGANQTKMVFSIYDRISYGQAEGRTRGISLRL
jgi:hypothetical protein